MSRTKQTAQTITEDLSEIQCLEGLNRMNLLSEEGKETLRKLKEAEQ